MRSEFERGFYKASIYIASKNILARMGNNEATLCEILNLIKTEHRKARDLPKTISAVEEEAALVRAFQIRIVLGKEANYNLKERDYQKGVNLLKKEMKRKGLVFTRFYLNPNS